MAAAFVTWICLRIDLRSLCASTTAMQSSNHFTIHLSWDGVVREFRAELEFNCKELLMVQEFTAVRPACLSGAASQSTTQQLIRIHPATLLSTREWTTLTPH